MSKRRPGGPSSFGSPSFFSGFVIFARALKVPSRALAASVAFLSRGSAVLSVP
jgi:hypothetical protein